MEPEYITGDVINANLFQVLIAVCTALYNALHFLLEPEAISQAVLILFVVQLEQISISQHQGGLGWGNQMTKLILQILHCKDILVLQLSEDKEERVVFGSFETTENKSWKETLGLQNAAACS